MLRTSLATTTRPRILLAEDDPDQSEMMKDILEVDGFQVDTAFSGDAALQQLKTFAYALVILDVRMPGLFGSDVLRLYRQFEHGSRTPIVIVSAFATDAQMLQYSKDGADRSFSKPYEVQDLIKSIRELVSGHAAPLNKTDGATP